MGAGAVVVGEHEIHRIHAGLIRGIDAHAMGAPHARGDLFDTVEERAVDAFELRAFELGQKGVAQHFHRNSGSVGNEKYRTLHTVFCATWSARNSQVSTTLSGLRDMLSIPSCSS